MVGINVWRFGALSAIVVDVCVHELACGVNDLERLIQSNLVLAESMKNSEARIREIA